MRMKSIIALLVAVVFTVGMVGLTFAAEVKGTVTKVEAKSVTVKDAAGKETKVDVSNSSEVKVGDMVTVKDGKATKEAAKKKSSSGGY
jgi:sRNA-binding protein